VKVRLDVNQPCPLPEDALLAEWATVLRDTGDWAWIVDSSWRLIFVTDEQRLSLAAGVELAPFVIGEHMFSSQMVEVSAGWRTGPTTHESWREIFCKIGGLVLADTSGGRHELRSLVDPALVDIVDELSATVASASWSTQSATGTTDRPEFVHLRALRIRDADGRLRGTAILYKPPAGMHVLGAMAWERDLGHLERIASVARAGRRPAAILFADLEGSSALSRTLSTSSYFAAGRRIVRATDRCVVDAGGLVGRHVGDGVVAFFPVEVFESESAAAYACVKAARDIQSAMPQVAERCGVDADQLTMRFGLHWGSMTYMGNISTVARSEVTALGDEVNEAARIEACATGGRVLASKQLVERLAVDHARAAGMDPDRLTYIQLSDVDGATEKARRDAPAIAVCEL
jgi:class 3 adenylate cyclase